MADKHASNPPQEQPLYDERTPEIIGSEVQSAVSKMLELVSGVGYWAQDPARSAPDSLNDADAAKVLETVSRAYMTWMNQGVRYWGALAECNSEYMETLLRRMNAMRGDPDASQAEQRALVDETERYLREFSELTMREGRVLQADFERLSQELRARFEQPLPAGRERQMGPMKP